MQKSKTETKDQRCLKKMHLRSSVDPNVLSLISQQNRREKSTTPEWNKLKELKWKDKSEYTEEAWWS